MNSKELCTKLEGVIGFPVTPFHDDHSLDLDGHRKNVRYMLEQPMCALVAAGADYVEGQDKYGRRSFPAYYETLQQRALEAIKYCLDLGLDINAVNDNGQTPLHGGVYIGGTLIVPFLVAQGAQLDVINRRGQTPVSYTHLTLPTILLV